MENTTSLRKTDFNYGLRGWLLCLYSMIGFMTVGGAFWSGTAQNTMVALKAADLGTDSSRILAINSVAGFIAIILLFGMGRLFAKFRTRIMSTVTLFICGIVLMFYGRSSSIVSYAICFVILDCMCNATSSVGLPQIAASYFPTKKGSFLGWATIGSNLAALVSLTILDALILARGTVFATTCFGFFTIVMGLINWFFIPSEPEKAHFRPDNDYTDDQIAAHTAMMTGPPHWTVKEALTNKNFWLLPIGYGLLFMCSNGFLSQMVPYQIEQLRAPVVSSLMATGSFESVGAAIGAAMADGSIAAKASGYMKILPVLALPGSVFSGWLDQKIGTRRTGMLMAFFYIIAGFAGGLIPFSTFSNWLFMGCFFFWTGANANLVMSHAASLYGPRDYPGMWARMCPIFTLMRNFASLTLSFFLAHSASSLLGYRHSYVFFGCAAIVALILIFFSDQHVFKEPGQAPSGTTKA